MKICIVFILFYAFGAFALCVPDYDQGIEKFDELKINVEKIESQITGDCPVPETLIRFTIKISTTPCPDLSKLGLNYSKALLFFEKNYGPVPGPLNLVIGEGIRLGYDPKEDFIHFSNTKKVINMGLNSDDIQIHELSHLLICHRFPGFCKDMNNERTAIAEAHADFFARVFNPDDCFGEQAYKDKECLRNYKTTLDYRLVTDEPHTKGNILVNYMLDKNVSHQSLRTFFEGEDYSLNALIPQKDRNLFLPSVKVQTENLKPRSIDDLAFKILPSSEGSISFDLSQELVTKYPRLKANVVPIKGNESFQIKTQSEAGKVKVSVNSDSQKNTYGVYNLIYENEGVVVGSMKFYLQKSSP
ncbi:MAG: hypothetical protein ACOYL6_08725 [Bacteriovoracaceae bacterium]